MIQLPIDSEIPQILREMRESASLILKAPPGTGKTTRLPPALIRERVAKRIYVLEPRRLAAKFAALRIADEQGWSVGQEIGYAFRFERRASDNTAITFLTEGTFLRILQNNPELHGIDLVVLDEFHERHLQTDTALACLRRLQETTRPDLKLLILSATLENEHRDQYLSRSRFLEVPVPHHPLEMKHLPARGEAFSPPLERKILSAVQEVLAHPLQSQSNRLTTPLGDILVFLPGMREIRQCEELLSSALASHSEISLHVLHGDLDRRAQDEILSPSPRAREHRRIILSTNLAESSVTIPGTRIVIDSGLHRRAGFDVWTGLPTLETKPIAQSSAIQRAGRAAREAPGVCFRLYSQADFNQRPAQDIPEISRTDLTETILLLAHTGFLKSGLLEWYTPPSPAAWQTASQLLVDLGAIRPVQANGEKGWDVTPLGSQMARVPLPPRLARVFVQAQRLGAGTRIAQAIALFYEGFERERIRSQLLHFTERALASSHATGSTHPEEWFFLFGFPDRVAQRRGERELLLANGETLKLGRHLHFPPGEELFLVQDVSPSGEVTRFAPVEESWLYDLEPFPLTDTRTIEWDPPRKNLQIHERVKLGKITLSESRHPLREDTALTEQEQNQIAELLWRELSPRWEALNKDLTRYALYAQALGHPPDRITQYSPREWVIEQSPHRTRLSEWENFEGEALRPLLLELDPEQRHPIDQWLPLELKLANGRTVKPVYENGMVFIEVKIQELFGVPASPTLAQGRVPCRLRLLGPHGRPLQVTSDLAGFWSRTYPELAKELRRDYPKHHWPEDPATAKPAILKRHLNG